ncbi:MAG TPA: hypothetical protein VEY12_04030 [Thermoplasmata archaeon]|nr:hypothetical protein [Thermoplasmata archaeon]
METQDPGPLLYAYKPVPANPMSVALLILLLIVTLVIGPIAVAPEGLWPLNGLCFLPLGLLLLEIALFMPNPTYVYEHGIEISLPLWRRLLGTQKDFRWEEIRDIYPASYEVAGSFMSPFASSAGTLVHAGLGLETRDGRRLLVRFTPGAIRAFRSESQGFRDALAVIRDRFARHGEPMVHTVRTFTDAEVLEMQKEARQPLVSIPGVFLAFFLPPTIVGVVFLAATAANVPLSALLAAAAVLLALVPPAFSMLSTLRRSERRNEILSELAKYQESQRTQSRAP